MLLIQVILLNQLSFQISADLMYFPDPANFLCQFNDFFDSSYCHDSSYCLD